MAVGAILGSAFSREPPSGLELEPVSVNTPWGEYELNRVLETDPPAHVSFRHGSPHRRLPHEIPYRAQAWAFREVGCQALLVTSSVGVLRPDLPLERLLQVRDLVTADTRPPDGSACTIFRSPCPLRSGHLILEDGVFSPALDDQVAELAPAGEEVAAGSTTGNDGSVRESLEGSRSALDRLVARFLRRGRPVAFGNRIYRFGPNTAV